MADFTIGSFNILWGSDEKTEKLQGIKKIINDLRLHILALQEFSSKNESSTLIIQNLLGKNWQIECFSLGLKSKQEYSEKKTSKFTESARFQTTDNGYAVIWDSRYFERLHHEEGNTSLSVMWKGILEEIKNNNKLARPPQILCFKSKLCDKFEIRLINTHITFSGNDPKVIYTKPITEFMQGIRPIELPKAIRKRIPEMDILMGIYDKISNFATNRSVYTVLLGDFNLEVEHIKPSLNYPMLVCKQAEKTTLIKDEKSYKDSGYFCNSYDHFIVNSIKCISLSSRFDTVKKYYPGNFIEHKKKLSDHIPIKLDLFLTNILLPTNQESRRD